MLESFEIIPKPICNGNEGEHDMERKHQLLVTSKALPGREEEYVSWYRNQHIKEVLEVPGFKSGQFFRSHGPDGADLGEFQALYEVEALEPAVLLGALMSRAGQMILSDAIDPSSVKFTFLLPA
jgi:hypothetical protein